MILNNNQIYNLYPVLLSLKRNKEIKLSVVTGFNILTNISLLEDIYKNILSSMQEITSPYIESINGDLIKIQEDKIEEVNKLLSELSYIENDVNLKKLKLEDIKDFNLTLDEIDTLMPIID